MADKFQVTGTNTKAKFKLKLHRGDGMLLLAMDWKNGKPPVDFVGFAIEYREPGGDRLYALKNRISFASQDGSTNPNRLSTRFSPIQKFRWTHFPRNADMAGEFEYSVTPVFMNSVGELSYGEPQSAMIGLRRETYPGKLNVTFTRGYVSSQSFVDRYVSAGPIKDLLPARSDDGLTFVPSHPKSQEALKWMGFEARECILEILDQAIADTNAEVRVVAYDLNEPEIVKRLEKLKKRLKIIIDNSGAHGKPHSAETQAAERLVLSAGASNVKRQNMGQLQHNKTITVNGPAIKAVVCGSTNLTWRGLYVQANNAFMLYGSKPVNIFVKAFDDYWSNEEPGPFGQTVSAGWQNLGITGISAKVSFSPHSASNALLDEIANDVKNNSSSSLFYSLAFLYQTPGAMQNAINAVTNSDDVFVYGVSDRKVGGIELQKPDGNVAPVFPSQLAKDVPEPFKSEPTGGSGNRMHHKFLVIDFDKPTARVYTGSYNFSQTADTKNGENLLLIRDRRIAVSYMVEALRMFDHYHFRVAQAEAAEKKEKLQLKRPPSAQGEKPWWSEHFTSPHRIRDRELFT